MRKLSLLLMGVLFFVVQSFAQRTITGRVTDENGNPVPAASVVLKNTRIGTVTSSNGSFSLNNVPANAILVITAIGKADQEVKIGAGNTYAVSLTSVSTEGAEVVVVAYGSAKAKADVAGSFTKIKGDEVHDEPTANVLDALQGKVSGLQIYTSSGEPSTTPSAQINGVGSIQGANTPLYVLDGIQVSAGTLISLNPDDIESVTVLKDPSTTSLYGSKAANGVIYYTTKQGRANNPRISVSAQYGVSNLVKQTKDLFNSFMNTKQLTDFWVAVGYRTQAQVDATLAQY